MEGFGLIIYLAALFSGPHEDIFIQSPAGQIEINANKLIATIQSDDHDLALYQTRQVLDVLRKNNNLMRFYMIKVVTPDSTYTHKYKKLRKEPSVLSLGQTSRASR